MKPNCLFSVFLLLLGSTLSGQVFPTYPIPSYNVAIGNYANFAPTKGTVFYPAKAKKEINTAVRGAAGSSANVWVYSLDGQDVLGPYTVYAGETLSVDIDDRQWGVLVQSAHDIVVDVWISENKSPGWPEFLPTKNR